MARRGNLPHFDPSTFPSSIMPSTSSRFDPAGDSFNKFAESFFSDFQDTVIMSSVFVGSVISFLYVGAIFLVIYLAYRCLSKHGLSLPSLVNIKNSNGGTGTAAEMTPLVPDSVIQSTTIENFINEVASERPVPFTARQLAGYTQNMSARLGAGGFGVVYKGMLPNGLDIAVKVLREDSGDEVKEQQFMAEVGTLWRTNHVNLIRLLGFCFDAGVRALVYELMPNGSLDKYLFDRRRHAVTPAELLAIAVGVARGLRYLHEECQKKIIHYDVKAGNVLLDESLTLKLTDFGIAQLLSRADAPAAVRGAPGTPGYIAPEVLGPGPVTEKCDVYSFGLLLFEVVGRRRNMDNDAAESREWLPLLAWTLYERGELMDLVRESHHMAAADEETWRETAERMCKVAFLCVQEQPDARPTMSTVVNMLAGQVPIPPPVFPFGWMYPSSRSSETIITIS